MTEIELDGRKNLDTSILGIALKSRTAGEGLPDIETPAAARGTETLAVPYKYGMHLPNYFDGVSDGLLREIEQTLPVSLTFLDNVKGDALVRLLELMHSRGRSPDLIFRPYFRPDDGVNPAIVEGYAQGAAIRMREEYFRHPLIQRAYEEGRWIVKIFNETNIGGEGFPRGRAGFADAARYWKQARDIVKGHFPRARIMSICPTPGNDDVWFTGDLTNAPYWFHGREAAKANASAVEIARSILSCVFREMFTLCDDLGAHAYGNLTRTVSGDLATWYARRFERMLVFLRPYLSPTKKLILNEWDMGYDDGQDARASAVVYTLRTIIAPNEDVAYVNHWWNGDDGEGSPAWEKHQTRKGGEFRPVVLAIRDFRLGASDPIPPPDDPEDPEDPTPPPSGEIALPVWCEVHRAVVPEGAFYWKLVAASWQDSDTSGGTRHIYVVDPHDPTAEMVVNIESTSVVIRARLEKPPGEPAGNVAMTGGGNRYRCALERSDTLLSDSVSGMTMPENQHVSYFLTFERQQKGVAVPIPSETLEQFMIRRGSDPDVASVPVTPGFALYDAIRRDGFIPNGPEVTEQHAGTSYTFRSGEHPTSGEKRTYYVVTGPPWGTPRFVVRTPAIVPVVPTPPALVVNRTLQSNNYDERPRDAGSMVLQFHHTGGGLQSSLNWLRKEQGKASVSSHYVVGKKGEIYQLVDESRRAWHSGAGVHRGREDPNDWTISVEIENKGDGIDPFPQVQLDAVVALSKDIVRRHRIPMDDITDHRTTRAEFIRRYPDIARQNRITHKVDMQQNFPMTEIKRRIYS
jgi:hypothetical protein